MVGLPARLINLLVPSPARQHSRRQPAQYPGPLRSQQRALSLFFLIRPCPTRAGFSLIPNDSLEQWRNATRSRQLSTRSVSNPEDHVLEIGCGWGGFALEVVKQTGCRLLGITISAEQYDWATRRVRGRRALTERIEILLSDYRHVQGRFSKIVSIEMLEAVGHRHLPAYFKTIDGLLAPHGTGCPAGDHHARPEISANTVSVPTGSANIFSPAAIFPRSER